MTNRLTADCSTADPETFFFKNKKLLHISCRPSRIRTCIRDLEGPCPNPLDDGPIISKNRIAYFLLLLPITYMYMFVILTTKDIANGRYRIRTYDHLLVRQALYHWANHPLKREYYIIIGPVNTFTKYQHNIK